MHQVSEYMQNKIILFRSPNPLADTTSGKGSGARPEFLSIFEQVKASRNDGEKEDARERARTGKRQFHWNTSQLNWELWFSEELVLILSTVQAENGKFQVTAGVTAFYNKSDVWKWAIPQVSENTQPE